MRDFNKGASYKINVQKLIEPEIKTFNYKYTLYYNNYIVPQIAI